MAARSDGGKKKAKIFVRWTPTAVFLSMLMLTVLFLGSEISNHQRAKAEKSLSQPPNLQPSVLTSRRTSGDDSKRTEISNIFSTLPLSFVENQGQMDARVEYHAMTPSGTLYLTRNEIVYQWIKRINRSEPEEGFPSKGGDSDKTEGMTVRAGFVGANSSVEVEGLEGAEAKFSYFRGNDPGKWVKGASTYGKVIYRELYPHIDLLVSGSSGRLKNEYRIKPGGRAEEISIRYEGIEELKINEKGQLEIRTSAGILVEDVPSSYQEIDGRRTEVRSGYRIFEKNTVGIEVGPYRESIDLIIDPLVYSTYFGGGSMDYGQDIVLDGSGNAFIVGETYSSPFPTTPGAYDTSYNGSGDVFIAKINAAGTSLLYSTYLGGASDDYGWAISIDEYGNAYLVGYTNSADFPTTIGVYDRTKNEFQDAFVAKINSAGTALSYSTFLGGNGDDYGYGIKAIEGGNCCVTGYTYSTNFPVTPGAYDTSSNGQYDVFITKLDYWGASLLFSTYLGGSGTDWASDMDMDASGNTYIIGSTGSTNFPTTAGAVDASYNGGTRDAFVAKMNASGTALLYSTYLGGAFEDRSRGVAVDGSGSAFVVGWTQSANFPTTAGAYDTSYNGNIDTFLAKLNPEGTSLFYSTYLGAGGDEYGLDIALERGGSACITGYTNTTDFPVTSGAYDATWNGGQDAFITKLSTEGSRLLYSSYLGGNGDDYGEGLTADRRGNVLVTGYTASNNFPTTPGAYDTTNNAGYDVFITKIFANAMFYLPFASLDNGNVNIGNMGTSPASITLRILDPFGVEKIKSDFTIPPNGVVRSWDKVGNIYNYGKPVAVEIIGDQPLVGDNIKWANPPYDTVGAGFTCGPIGVMSGDTFYFPFSSFGWTNAYCVIANPAAAPVNGRIGIFDKSGVLQKWSPFTLPARGLVRSWELLGSIQAAADPALVKIVTDLDVVVEAVKWEENRRGWGFAVFPSSIGGGTKFTIPFGSLDNGNVNIASIGGSPASVSFAILDANGNTLTSANMPVASNGVARSWDSLGNIYNIGKPVAVEINSFNLPVIVDNIKWAGPPYDTVGAGFTCGPLTLTAGKTFYFPFSSFGGSTNAYCVIANTTTSLVNGRIGIFDQSGTLKKWTTFTIPAKGLVRSWEIIGSIQEAADPALVKVVTDVDVVVEAVRWEQNRRGWGFALLPTD